MSRRAFRPSFHRTVLSVGAIALAGALLTGCGAGGAAPQGGQPAEGDGRPRVGVILGGGGEVGIAWQLGVLDALNNTAGLTPDKVDVAVGTSAGAYSGAYYTLGLDLDALVEQERRGEGAGAPVAGGENGLSAIPPELMAALVSTEGTIEERGRRIGELAMRSELPITSADYVGYVTTMLPGPEWPERDLRITSVDARTGETVLWRAADGVPLAAALASSSAVPGFLPVVEINDGFYTDAPRTSFSRQLVDELDLDAVVYIGMPTPNLSNTVEEKALDELQAGGLQVVRITGSEEANRVAANALDPAMRPVAVDLGLQDGENAAAAVRQLLG
ncbi:hypothetical protein BJF78_00900 [Pseudonocardia sp. CNS-139]|nr:hypothetical protein BJF78_00900 [Pseudonocardia sp. CNS-139]